MPFSAHIAPPRRRQPERRSLAVASGRGPGICSCPFGIQYKDLEVSGRSPTISNSAHPRALPIHCHPEASPKDLRSSFGNQFRHSFRVPLNSGSVSGHLNLSCGQVDCSWRPDLDQVDPRVLRVVGCEGRILPELNDRRARFGSRHAVCTQCDLFPVLRRDLCLNVELASAIGRMWR